MVALVDDLILAGVVGGAGLIGGNATNAANAKQANRANELDIYGQIESQNFIRQQQGAQNRFNTGAALQAQDFAREMHNSQIGTDYDMMREAEIFNSASAERAMSFTGQQAQLQRDYETGMSNTAYRRAVADMKAAGLNPILSAGTGGASTPTVSAGSGTSASISPSSVSSPTVGAAQGPSLGSAGSIRPQKAEFKNFAGDIISSGMQAMKLLGDLKIQDSALNQQNAGALASIGQSQASSAQALKTTAETPFVSPQAKASIQNTIANTAKVAADTAAVPSTVQRTEAETRKTNLDNYLTTLSGKPGTISSIGQPISQVFAPALQSFGKDALDALQSIRFHMSPKSPDLTAPRSNPAQPKPMSKSEIIDQLRYGPWPQN